MSWLLLLHQIPPNPPYFRAKILRRLSQIGALPVKNSAYLLPESDDTREDFEWLCREITKEGGTAWLFRADVLAGMSTEQVQDGFRQLRAADYEEMIATAKTLLADAASRADYTKLVHRFEERKKIDFFEHPGRAEMAELLARLSSFQTRLPQANPIAPGRIWVTRSGIKVDRIASAWLIRRFIDPQATFRFVDPATYHHAGPALRFDMFEGEFTHEGDLCTFEVLAGAHHLAEHHPELQPIAEMVHDIDLKDSRYGRLETNGLARMLDGLCARTTDDSIRIEQGSQLFDSLLQSFKP